MPVANPEIVFSPAAPSVKEGAAGSAAHHRQTEPNAQLASQAEELERLLPAAMRAVFDLPPPENALADLPVAQFRLCILLSRQGRRTMSQLGEELHISVSAVTQMADRLEKVNLVERVTEKTGDRRTRHLQLTQYGHDLILVRRTLRTERAAQMLALLEPAMRDTVLHVLQTVLTASRTLPRPETPPTPADDM